MPVHASSACVNMRTAHREAVRVLYFIENLLIVFEKLNLLFLVWKISDQVRQLNKKGDMKGV
jgi:hypothetical protein